MSAGILLLVGFLPLLCEGTTLFGHKHYVPVLKGKRAEFPALQNLHSKDGVTPLLEAVPTLAVDYIPKQMASAWDQNRPYFIDMLFWDDEDDDGNPADHPLQKCFDTVAKLGQEAIPVTGSGRSPAYQAALANIANTQKKGFAIRLVPDDFEDEDALGDTVDAIVELVGVAPGSIDIIIDADTVAGASAASVAQLHRANISLLPHLSQWRTLTVVAGAFPMSLAPLTTGNWNLSPRADWRGWRAVVSGSQKPPRLPTFGDYGIAHPDLPPTGRATILAQLRYTIPDQFLIWKGHNVFRHPKRFDQFLDICKDLVKRPEFMGPAFSYGDAEIYAKATTGGSSGNAETWRGSPGS